MSKCEMVYIRKDTLQSYIADSAELQYLKTKGYVPCGYVPVASIVREAQKDKEDKEGREEGGAT